MNSIFSYAPLTPEIEKKLYADIIEFRTTFDLAIESPEQFGEKSDNLHTALWLEELTELAEAKNIVEIADALTDQTYVLLGRVCELGYWPPEVRYIVSTLLKVCEIKNIDFIRCWDEVHSSNMTKVAKNEDELKANIEHYEKNGVEITPVKTDVGYVLKCAKDCIHKGKPIRAGKVMKSIFYKDADLSFVGAQ